MSEESNGKNALQTLYKAAVILLLMVSGFIGASIYNKVGEFPEHYVTLERYKCDILKIESGIDNINRKLDRVIIERVGEKP